MIPKRFFLVWNGTNFSYLRYLCVESLCRLHPDWRIDLFFNRIEPRRKTWVGDLGQDFEVNVGNYIDRFADKGINIHFSYNDTEHPIHASDIQRYDELFENGGVYVDSDVFFVRSINDLYDRFQNSEQVITYDQRLGFQIGFLAAAPSSEMFGDLRNIARNHLDGQHYQSAGVNAIYELLNPGCQPHTPSFHNHMVQTRYDQALQHKYPGTYLVPSRELYPLDGPRAQDVFESPCHDIDVRYCLHLFGGSPAFQKYNILINENNIHEFDGIFFQLVKESANV